MLLKPGVYFTQKEGDINQKYLSYAVFKKAKIAFLTTGLRPI
jgi:hypothetical protein